MNIDFLIICLQLRKREMEIKMCRQIRCIKRFAKSHHINNLDQAAEAWVASGCAARWASKQN